MGNEEFALIIDSLIRPPRKITFLYLLLTKFWMLLWERSSSHLWMSSTMGTIRSKSIIKTIIRLLSLSHGGPFPTGYFHLACVMPRPPSRGWYLVFLLILCMIQLRFMWMTSPLMEMFSRKPSPTCARF